MEREWNHKLVLSPHFDDEILCCTSILKDSIVVVVTRGDLGTGGLRNELDEATYCRLRREESERACEAYGVFKFISLGLGEAEVGRGVIGVNLLPYIKRASLVFCTDVRDEQICHIEIGKAVTTIVNKMKDSERPDLFYYAHKIFPAPQILNCLNPEQWEKKLAAIRTFKTQEHWLLRHLAGKENIYQNERFYASELTVKGVFHDSAGKSFSQHNRRTR